MRQGWTKESQGGIKGEKDEYDDAYYDRKRQSYVRFPLLHALLFHDSFFPPC